MAIKLKTKAKIDFIRINKVKLIIILQFKLLKKAN